MNRLVTRLYARDRRGFSAVEALISVVVAAIMVLLGVTVLQRTQKSSRAAYMQGDSQQGARVAIDLLSQDLRSIGYGRDSGQPALAWAGPWDVIFNANMQPLEDNMLAPGFPAAIDPGLAPSTVPPAGGLYAPGEAFTTGAETIRFTLDSNGDGLVDAADRGDDREEATTNPRDYVLRREVYGAMGDGTNGGTGETVALVRGPDPGPDGTLPPPLISYWIDDDENETTPLVLHGDADGDGELSQAEIAGLGPVPLADLPLVGRMVVTVVTEDTESGGRTGYRARTLVSSVSVRNHVDRTAFVSGTVWVDTDGNGLFDADEWPLRHAKIRLSNGLVRITDEDGRYSFELDGGAYTVAEIDPPGYESTTPNFVSLTVQNGSTATADFGDRPMTGISTVQGVVFHDIDWSGIQDTGEPGIANVVVTLNTGARDTTNASGEYAFLVGAGDYVVTEIDSAGWNSTTSNEIALSVVEAATEVVDFGDIPADAGTLRGMVFLDTNVDGLFDGAEPGIGAAVVMISPGDTVTTDADGWFELSLPAGLYDLREFDLPGYSSSTPNHLPEVEVHSDSTTYVYFGDIFNQDIDFTVTSSGETSQPVSLATVDLGEDGYGDRDIVLGTRNPGQANLHVWHNLSDGAVVLPDDVFSSMPTFSRDTGYSIPEMVVVDCNQDSVDDILTALDYDSGNNFSLWITQTATGTVGTLPMSATSAFQTTSGSAVGSVAGVDWPGWGAGALLVGTRETGYSGHVELWTRSGSSSYSHQSAYDLYGFYGEAVAVATGDLNGDGYADLVVGQDNGTDVGRVSVLFANPVSPWTWVPVIDLTVEGAVTSLVLDDMGEDDLGDLDIVVGARKGDFAGTVELWLNQGDGLFGFGTEVTRVRNDVIYVNGAVLDVKTAKADLDVFPDLIVGTRTATYAGRLVVYRTAGDHLVSQMAWMNEQSGEVVTLAIDDFDGDGRSDIAAGTRTSESAGRLYVFFGR